MFRRFTLFKSSHIDVLSRWYDDSTCSTVQYVQFENQAQFSCYRFDGIYNTSIAPYASFKCNANGTSTITPYSDMSCTLPKGSPFTIDPTSCTMAVSNTNQYFTTACAPPATTLSGYYKMSLCASTEQFYLYPLGSCNTVPDSTHSRVFSAQSNKTTVRLDVSFFASSDCSDMATAPLTRYDLNKTCSSGGRYKGSIIGTTLPTLTKGHRYINFYSDGSCSGNVQNIYHIRDGCTQLPGFYAHATFKCHRDGSSTVQYFGRTDFNCSQAPIGRPMTVLPSECSLITPGYNDYLNTTCIH